MAQRSANTQLYALLFGLGAAAFVLVTINTAKLATSQASIFDFFLNWFNPPQEEVMVEEPEEAQMEEQEEENLMDWDNIPPPHPQGECSSNEVGAEGSCDDGKDCTPSENELCALGVCHYQYTSPDDDFDPDCEDPSSSSSSAGSSINSSNSTSSSPTSSSIGSSPSSGSSSSCASDDHDCSSSSKPSDEH